MACYSLLKLFSFPGSSPGQHSGAPAVETSCATVCKLSGGSCLPPAKGELFRPRAGRAAGRGWRPRAARGAGRCRGRAAGPKWPGRTSAGARGCECAMRARRGECVSPLSPSFPASRPARRNSERPPKPQPLRAAPLPGAAWARRVRGPGVGEQRRPRARCRRTARPSRSEVQRERSARPLPRLREAAGPARRPPRLFPFSLHPLAPSPHALQGSKTGSQRLRGPPPQ